MNLSAKDQAVPYTPGMEDDVCDIAAIALAAVWNKPGKSATVPRRCGDVIIVGVSQCEFLRPSLVCSHETFAITYTPDEWKDISRQVSQLPPVRAS